MQEIITPRLSLRLMTADFLEASLDSNAQKTGSLIGFKITNEWLDEKDLAQHRLKDYRADTKFIEWGLRAVGLKDSKEMVGFIGFHSRPNPDYLRGVAAQAIEFGYTIFVRNRRRGFAEEAIQGLMSWALEQYPLENFIASVAPSNVASTALVKKLKFEKIGEQIDDVDGLEFVYSLAVSKLKWMDTV